jgi:hypothetical protein
MPIYTSWESILSVGLAVGAGIGYLAARLQYKVEAPTPIPTVAITGILPEAVCSKCHRTVTNFQYPPEGGVICANCVLGKN